MLYPVKQLDYFLGNWHRHFSVVPHTTLVCDCFRTALQASIIWSQLFRRLNLSPYNPSYLSPTVLNICWQINLQHVAMNRPWLTPANLRNKYIKNVRQQTLSLCFSGLLHHFPYPHTYAFGPNRAEYPATWWRRHKNTFHIVMVLEIVMVDIAQNTSQKMVLHHHQKCSSLGSELRVRHIVYSVIQLLQLLPWHHTVAHHIIIAF